MIRAAKDFLSTALLGALLTLAVATVFLVLTAHRVLDELPVFFDRQIAMARNQVIEEIRGARTDAVSEIGKTRSAAVREIRQTRKAIVLQSLDARLDLDEKIVAGLAIAHRHALEFEDRLDDTNKILLAVAKPVHDAAWQISNATPELVERTEGLAKGLELTAVAIGNGAPGVAANLQSITKHADRLAGSAEAFTDHLQKHQPWWWKVLGLNRGITRK